MSGWIPDTFDIKQGLNKMKNMVLNRSQIEIKVREATSNDPWGASGSLKQEVAEATYNFEECKVILETIWSRFGESGKNWRKVYKTLQLMEYLVGHGAERVIDEFKDSQNMIRALKSFTYVDEKGKDQGQAIRDGSKKLLKLLGDDQAIIAERKAAKKSNKLEGISSDSSRFYKRGGQHGRGNDDHSKSRYDEDYDSSSNRREPDYEDNRKKRNSFAEDEQQQEAKSHSPAAPVAPIADDDEEHQQAHWNAAAPAVVVSKPNKQTTPQSGQKVRRPSGGPNSAQKPAQRPAPQPAPQQQQQNSNIFDLEAIIQPSQPAPHVIFDDPFDMPNHIQKQQNQAQLKNAFGDDGFGSTDFEPQWQEGAEAAPQNESDQAQKAPSFMDDLTAGIVDLSLTGDKKKAKVSTSVNAQQGAPQAQKKTMNDLKREKGGMISPTPKGPMAPIAPMTTIPAIKPSYPVQPQGGYGANPFAQPMSYSPQPVGYAQQPVGYAPQPMGYGAPQTMGRGYPPPNAMGYPAAHNQQMGRGNNAFYM